jgi:hypothetical protein
MAFIPKKTVIKRKAVGESQQHADAFVRAIVEFQNSLSTKADIEKALSQLAVLKAVPLKRMMVIYFPENRLYTWLPNHFEISSWSSGLPI